jgi:hypothetical protein
VRGTLFMIVRCEVGRCGLWRPRGVLFLCVAPAAQAAGSALADCASALVSGVGASGSSSTESSSSYHLLDACTLLRLLCALCPGLDAACTPRKRGNAAEVDSSVNHARAACAAAQAVATLAMQVQRDIRTCIFSVQSHNMSLLF